MNTSLLVFGDEPLSSRQAAGLQRALEEGQISLSVLKAKYEVLQVPRGDSIKLTIHEEFWVEIDPVA